LIVGCGLYLIRLFRSADSRITIYWNRSNCFNLLFCLFLNNHTCFRTIREKFTIRRYLTQHWRAMVLFICFISRS
jgi:hypothetical protein